MVAFPPNLGPPQRKAAFERTGSRCDFVSSSSMPSRAYSMLSLHLCFPSLLHVKSIVIICCETAWRFTCSNSS